MSLPLDMWVRVLDRAEASSDAARLACACRDTAAAYRACRFFRLPRVAPGGEVREPASGAFDAEFAPGGDETAARAAIPSGGSVLLLPGAHRNAFDAFGPRALVYAFGRGRARIDTPLHSPVFANASFVGVGFEAATFSVFGGARVRVQQCTFSGNVYVFGARTEDGEDVDTTFDRCAFEGNVFVEGGRAAFVRCAFEATVVVNRASPHFLDSSFRNTRALTSSCICLRASRGCVIERNTIGAYTCGIFMVDSEARIRGNELCNAVYNVALHGGSRATIVDNRMRGMRGMARVGVVGECTECIGVVVDSRSDATVSGNAFDGHLKAVVVADASATVVDNVMRGGKIGVHVLDAARATYAIRGNDASRVRASVVIDSALRNRAAAAFAACGVGGVVWAGRAFGLGWRFAGSGLTIVACTVALVGMCFS